jgi:hypothetical protein
MHSLTDALRMMHKSFVLAQIRQALEAHRAEHSGYYYACESSACSQIAIDLRCYVEAAQEEQDAPYKLSQARIAARNADPKASDEAIEYRASLFFNNAAENDSVHPVQYLESPSDRIFNLKYPGLNFRGGLRRDALPAIAASYYLRFCKTGAPGVLLEFIREHPIEFELSGWVLAAFGRILIGMPRPSEGEEQARILFRDYWKEIKRPKRTLSAPQLFVLAVASQERQRFSTAQHRIHFRHAAMWMGKQSGSDSDASFASFQNGHKNLCPCVGEIDFFALKTAVDRAGSWSYTRPAIANVLQEYIGIVCGIPSRTLRSWSSHDLLIPRRQIRRAKSRR